MGTVARVRLCSVAEGCVWYATCVITVEVEKGDFGSAVGWTERSGWLPVLRKDACGQLLDTGIITPHSAPFVCLTRSMSVLTITTKVGGGAV